jgi:RimJ/RimL family protein N-acetyltransferase
MFNLQPTHLQNEWVILQPLQPNDFETLYTVASDPLIWEQHPSKTRYQRDVFKTFFEGAMESGGAFMMLDAKNNEPIGSSRFYTYNEAESSIEIGYTFYARKCWGLPYNRSAKQLMIDHAFQFVDHVIFNIGANNIRSQKAIGKIGAIKTGEKAIAYYGEVDNLNYIYTITKTNWQGL